MSFIGSSNPEHASSSTVADVCSGCGYAACQLSGVKSVPPKSDSTPRVDRHVSDEDIFEHVIVGVRVHHILQMLRELDEPASRTIDESDPDCADDERPH